MKKLLAVIMALMFVLCTAGLTACFDNSGSNTETQNTETTDNGKTNEKDSENNDGDNTIGLVFTLKGTGYSVTGYNGTATEVYIRSKYNGLPVTNIGERAFYNCSSLTEITIPNSVTSIENSAFYNCTSLKEITIPDSVTSIGYGAFDDCLCVETVDGVSYVDKWLYKCDTDVTEVTIKEDTVGIVDSAFYDCSSLTSITIPDTVTRIGERAFYDCSSLTSITIPDSVTSIEKRAFVGCPCVETVDGVSYVDKWLYSCFDINVTTVTIKEDTVGIVEGAFDDYYLENIIVEEGNGNYKSIDGNLYSKDGKTLIKYAIGKTDTAFTIPDEVTSIGERAFFYCSSLTEITIPDSVTSIGNAAFSICTGLTQVTIGNGVTSIGLYAFGDCGRLTEITIPNSVTSIGDWAFSDCSNLTQVTIGNGVTSIGEAAFDNCSSLTSVYYNGTAEEWAKISIVLNSNLTSATRYYYSEIEPTESGNYWHYVDGVPTKW